MTAQPELDRMLLRKVDRLTHATNAIINDGQIILPGIRSGSVTTAYEPLASLYQEIRQAKKRLSQHHSKLASEQSASTTSLTPLTPLTPSTVIENLVYKREDLTTTRAYKVRGAVNAMAATLDARHFCRRFVAVSTGNHALGVLKAAELLRPESVRIFVPNNTSEVKLQNMEVALLAVREKGVTAEILFAGETFDEAKAWAKTQIQDEYYLDPYSDEQVIAGQGTIGIELSEQLKPLLEANPYIDEVVIIAPVGGGGLLTGLAAGLRMSAAWEPCFRAVNLSFIGLRLLELESVLGDAIRVKVIASKNREYFSALGIPTLEMSDDHMQMGLDFIKSDLGIVVEGASSGTVFPVLHYDTFYPSRHRLVVSVLSGANI